MSRLFTKHPSKSCPRQRATIVQCSLFNVQSNKAIP